MQKLNKKGGKLGVKVLLIFILPLTFYVKIKNKFMENIEEKVKNAKYVFSYYKGNLLKENEGINIIIADDLIYKRINGNVEYYIDERISKEVFNHINLYLEIIIELSEKEEGIQYYKDKDFSRDQIILDIKDKSYTISRKVDNEEISKFYDKIISEILEIVK